MQLISLAIDPVAALTLDAKRLGISTPLLSDPDRKVSNSYGLPLQNFAGEPGHIFVLVGKDGSVKWAKDYAIPGKNPVMYVPVDELDAELSQVLGG